MDKTELIILTNILAKKQISTDILEKSYNVWLNDFMGVYANYGRSVFGNDVICETKDNGNVFSITLYPDAKAIDSIEYIEWDFERNAFLYIDEFNECIIHTSSFFHFIKQFHKLHPSIVIPSVYYHAIPNYKYDIRILHNQLGE